MPKRITITVPQKKGDKWIISFNKSTRQRNTAATVLLWVKRHVRACPKDEKLSIRVKYSKDTFNNTIASSEPHTLYYAVICFLEDYLHRDTILDEEKIWEKFLNGGRVLASQ